MNYDEAAVQYRRPWMSASNNAKQQQSDGGGGEGKTIFEMILNFSVLDKNSVLASLKVQIQVAIITVMPPQQEGITNKLYFLPGLQLIAAIDIVIMASSSKKNKKKKGAPSNNNKRGEQPADTQQYLALLSDHWQLFLKAHQITSAEELLRRNLLDLAQLVPRMTTTEAQSQITALRTTIRRAAKRDGNTHLTNIQQKQPKRTRTRTTETETETETGPKYIELPDVTLDAIPDPGRE